MIPDIKKQLNSTPSSSGVYFFKDTKGWIIYIGKAMNLKARVKSYFIKNALYGIKASMLSKIAKIDYKTTDTEIDALILESQLIKKHRPKYNVMLKDDKNYFYVVFTNDEFPKVYITHQPLKLKTKNPGRAGYKLKTVLGPYTDGQALKTTLRYLRKIFPYCTCKIAHKLPCLKSHLGLCLGICCLKQVSKEQMARLWNGQANGLPGQGKWQEYQKNIKSMIAVLSGKKKGILKKLEKEMRTAAMKEDFEKAASLKNKIIALKNIFAHRIFEREKNNILSSAVKSLSDLFGLKTIRRIEFYDISNIQGQLATGSMVVFDDNKIDKSQYRKFKIKTVHQSDDPAMIKEVLMRRLKHTDWPMPDLIIVDGGITQYNAAKKVIAAQEEKDVKLAALAKNPDRILLSPTRQIALKNLPENLRLLLQNLRNEAHRFAISYHKKLRHKKLKEEFSY